MHLLNLEIEALIFKSDPLLSKLERTARQTMHHTVVASARWRLQPTRILRFSLPDVDMTKNV